MDAKKVLTFFREMNEIPRGSYNEKAVSDWLVAFAKERNFEVRQDKALNVIIKKPATPGYEDHPAIILQGHMDMVCEKTDDSNHDFTKDPIAFIVDGDWLHADRTTLGADNGIAVAMSLAVLDSDTIQHGPLTCIFTTSEETSMGGAKELDATGVVGKYLLNIDTEEEGDFVVSCAGGCNVDVEFPTFRDNRDKHFSHGLRLSLTGFLGGHSGMEINKERANGNVVLGRILYELNDQYKYQLGSFIGGTKHNAIPRTADVVIAVAEDDVNAVKTWIAAKVEALRIEFAAQDPDINVVVTDVEAPETVYAGKTTEIFLTFLYLADDGVFGYSHSIENLVETSDNIGVISEIDGRLHTIVSTRGSAKSPLEFLVNRILVLARTVEAKATIKETYPIWEYEPGSALESQALAIYEKMTGHKPHVSAIHAGLECGLLKGALPDTEMISYGPTIVGAHTPQEKANIPSIERMFNYTVELLKELK